MLTTGPNEIGNVTAVSEQPTLIASLCRALCERHGVQHIDVLETHISYVLLTGQYAYKIKKAIKLAFLDFSTLALRHFYCQEELRLNQRNAPGLYFDVVAIGGTPEAPIIDGPEPAIEYAVKMREFAQSHLASRMLARGELLPAHVDVLATKLAAFHRACERATPVSDYGTAQGILRRAQDNFSEIRRLKGEGADLDWLQEWTEQEFAARLTTFVQRRSGGFVRECHGDLHLGNIVQLDGELTFFDGIEFSEDLRWIDVMNEVAFLLMDLHAHERADLAYRFLNSYLERSGDYAGLTVLRFYVVYRALVRAKIALLSGSSSDDQSECDYHRYVKLAQHWAQPTRPALILTHGLSGSGKTTVTQSLLEAISAIRVRSDVERKRLAGLEASARSQSKVGGGLYIQNVTDATYRRLMVLAQAIVHAGYRVIIDATFLKRVQRRMFRAWASAHGVAFAILTVAAPEAALRERVVRRAQEGTNASEANLAVLDRQLQIQEPLTADELLVATLCDTTQPLDEASLAAEWQTLLERLESGQPCPDAHACGRIAI